MELALKEEYLPEAYVQSDGWGHLTPSNHPVPRPDYLPPDWMPNYAALRKPTPKDYRKVARNKDGMVMYRYAPISFFIKRANEVWGEGNWSYEIVKEERGEPAANHNFEYTVIVQFVAPCLFRPMIGVGSSTFYANNPQESMAKTRNAALTSALKSALKQFGIGRDVEEDDPEVAKATEGRIATISMLHKKLAESGRLTAANAVVRKHQPTALLETGEVLVAAIDFENLEPIQRGLQEIVLKGATAPTRIPTEGNAVK